MVGAQNERLTADAVVNITYNPHILLIYRYDSRCWVPSETHESDVNINYTIVLRTKAASICRLTKEGIVLWLAETVRLIDFLFAIW